ncbi:MULTISPECIES: hypothetical protein [Bifidobacterium]|uniref:hypothetical protein n=1 Tax=Bifidobacterium TaxID=1678 RepID=UPI001BDBF5DA|nr:MULTISPECIES: hypothetical protein [Bifidobacterium]MBT1161671.1 hypothetical protein [Bifidobacterium sp. SO1]MBW3078714.1 hypothetical protein [Bifidobacterium simiiventris]
MPWWIWLLLALFMIAMIVAGVAYAVIHAMRGIRNVSGVGARIGELLNAMQEPESTAETMQTPSFAEPLADVADRYATAHAEVVERQAAKRERHIRQWAEWNSK